MAVALQTDQTGPVLAFSGALIVAIITWVSSDRRQERALVAERERQFAKLAHDRELADLTDLRALLDEAARVLHRGKVACLSVSRLIDTEDAEVWGEFHNTFEELLMARYVFRGSGRVSRLFGVGRVVMERGAAGRAWRVEGGERIVA